MSFGLDPVGGFMFSVVPILVVLGFVVVFGLIIFNVVKGIGRWNYNNSQPVLTVISRIVSKRTDVSSSMSSDTNDMGHHHHTYTYYYVTFEVESGDRMELQVRDNEYGLLAEGDTGRLTFQGTRFLGFQREKDQMQAF